MLDLTQNCYITLMVFLKELVRKIVDFENKLADNKNHEKIPSMQRYKGDYLTNFKKNANVVFLV